MSFQETRDDISICNKALSRVKQQPLSGTLSDPINQGKHSGRECSLWYKTIVRQVLSMHHWGLATKRTLLAYASVNDRALEWPFAYDAPSDMAFPVVVGPYSSTAGISYYQGVGSLLASLYGKPIFLYESGLIYSILDSPTLDYVSYDITEQDFNEAVESLIVLYLASTLARSVAKNDALAKELHQEATNRANIEIAHNLNMSNPRYGEMTSDTELARNGYDPLIAQYGIYR